MKRIIILVAAICLMATSSHAFTNDIYGTWELSGSLDAEVRYMYGWQAYYHSDFEVDFQIGQISYDEVAGYNTEDITYRPLNTKAAIDEMVNETINGTASDNTVNYIYLPEGYLDLDTTIDTRIEDTYLPGFGVSDLHVWNNISGMGVSIYVDGHLFDGAQDMYYLGLNKFPNAQGGYNFYFGTFDGAESWSESILYTSVDGEGQIRRISSDYLSPTPVAPVPEPEPVQPSPEPSPEPEEPVRIIRVPVFDDDGH
jgi:hypothetical protein